MQKRANSVRSCFARTGLSCRQRTFGSRKPQANRRVKLIFLQNCQLDLFEGSAKPWTGAILVNIHFDHRGRESRGHGQADSSKGNTGTSARVVVTGDFNAGRAVHLTGLWSGIVSSIPFNLSLLELRRKEPSPLEGQAGWQPN